MANVTRRDSAIILLVLIAIVATIFFQRMRSGTGMDTSGDGIVDQNEIRRHLEQRGISTMSPNPAVAQFESFDSNSDNLISIEEIPLPDALFGEVFESTNPIDLKTYESRFVLLTSRIEAIERAPLSWFILADKDSDGVLTPDESLVVFGNIKSQRTFDLDRNGAISAAEAEQATVSHQRWRPIRAATEVAETFDRADSNKDGYLSLAELRFRGYLIRDLDRDGDERLSRDEVVRIYELARSGPARYELYSWESRFLQARVDGKDYLTYDELGLFAWMAQMIDSNKDKRIDMAEYVRIPALQFLTLKPLPID